MGGNSVAHGYRHHLDVAPARSGRRSRAAVIGVAALLAAAVPARAALSAERLALHQFEDGPILPATHVFLPGEPIFFSCRLQGFQTEAAKDELKSVRLTWKVEVSDPAGAALTAGARGKITDQVSTMDKNWFPKFLHNFIVPPFAPGGTYRIKVSAKDEIGGTQLDTEVEFPVRGHAVEPSPVLAGRNLHFLRTEADGPPLDPVLYHPGETLWARFDMTGYKFGEKNHYSVEYGLAVLRESGEQVFAQPAAAADSKESFYPQRYVPGALSLHLNPDVPEGTYTLVVTMVDQIGGQTAEVRGTFRIEK